MSNSASMTLEEKLVQHIKDVGLGALISDEDAITELTRKAVDSALMQPRRSVGESWNRREEDSPVVAAARKVADAALQKIFDEKIAQLFNSAEAKDALNVAIANSFPAVLERALMNAISAHQASYATVLEQKVLEHLRKCGLPV